MLRALQIVEHNPEDASEKVVRALSRAEEKALARAADEERLASGAVSAEELSREVGFFSDFNLAGASIGRWA